LHTVNITEELRDRLRDWRRLGDHIALVPTMGNLHRGHLSLIELAHEHADRVVVSIFVNPTQFGEGEDFDQYPKTLERDQRHLKRANVALLFAPDVDTVYPFGINAATQVSVPVLSDVYCGKFRPGHFDGVSSVVMRLFGIVQPDVAVFGQKDYQQQVIIRRFTEDFSLPIRIVTGQTVRDDDGLALSSRNQYLTDEERTVAPVLFKVLQSIAAALKAGERNFEDLETAGLTKLEQAGFVPDYVVVRRAEDLSAPQGGVGEFVVFAAATLGQARLIDNVIVGV